MPRFAAGNTAPAASSWAAVFTCIGDHAAGHPNRRIVQIDESEAAALVATLDRVRLAGAAADVHRLGLLEMPEWAGEALREVARRWKVHDLAVVDALAGLAAQLNSGGIEFRVLKGAATAHLDHRTPSLRELGDIDLLIRPDDFLAAIDLLVAGGMRVVSGPPRRRWEMDHAVTLMTPAGVEVDVHHRLFRRTPGLWAGELDLWSDPEEFVLGDVGCLALPRPVRLLNAALHFATSPPDLRHLSSLLDVVVIGADPSTTAEAFRLADSCGLGRMLSSAMLTAAPDVFEASPAVVAPGSPSRAWRERQISWAYPQQRRRLFREELLYGARRGPIRRVADYATLAWPKAEDLRAIGVSRGDHLRSTRAQLMSKRNQGAEG